jgi:hypothetical protein
MYPPKVKDKPTSEMPSRVVVKREVDCVLIKDGSLNLRVTEKHLERMFFEELGELVKVKIRREF